MARALSRRKRVHPDKLEFARSMRKNPTTPEALLWGALRACRLEGWKFRRQQWMYGYIADFYCEEANLCVEIDGASHRNLIAEEWDKRRDFVSAIKGIRVIRVSNKKVTQELPAVLKQLLAALGGPCPSRVGSRN